MSDLVAHLNNFEHFFRHEGAAVPDAGRGATEGDEEGRV